MTDDSVAIQSVSPKYSVKKHLEAWWVFLDDSPELGPYTTKAEATEARKGRIAFDQEPEQDIVKTKPTKRKKEARNGNEDVELVHTDRGVRGKLFGHPFTSVIRWMGKEGMSHAQATKVFEHYKVPISKTTVTIQLKAGATGDRGEPASLNKGQQSTLKKLAK